MSNDLNKHTGNIHEQANQVMEAVKTLKEKQKSEKRSKRFILIIVLLIIIFLVIVCIISIIMSGISNKHAQEVYTQTQYVNTITQEAQDICNGLHVESIEASLIPQDSTSFIYDETIKKSIIPVRLTGKMLLNNTTSKELKIAFPNVSPADWIRVIETVNGKENNEFILMKDDVVISPNSSAYVDLEAYFFQGLYYENPQIIPNGKIQFYIEYDNTGVDCPFLDVSISVGPTEWVEE